MVRIRITNIIAHCNFNPIVMKNIQSLQKTAYVVGLLACIAVPFVVLYVPVVPAELAFGLGASGLLSLWAGFIPQLGKHIPGV